MVQTPKIACILINWNNYQYTDECLASLLLDLDVVVVDNGSDKANVDALEKDERVKHLIKNEKNEGYVVASNQAIMWALENGYDYIWQLDNDTVVDPGCLDALFDGMANVFQEGKVGIVGGKIYYYDNPKRLQWCGESMNFWLGDVQALSNGIKRVIGAPEYNDSKYNKIREVDFVVSWCALTKREVFEKIGLLDESFFFGWEDNDFCIRAKKAGYKIVWTPHAKLLHRYSSAFALDGHLQYHGPKNRFKFMRKHATLPQYLVFNLWFFGVHFWLATAYYLLWARKPSIYPKFLKGVWDGFRGED